MATDRDHHAARLSRQGWRYSRIADYLGYPDRRAAHRGVLRGLAEAPADAALFRAYAQHQTDNQLCELQRRLFVLLDEREPYSWDGGRGARAYLRIMDSLLRVSHARCKLRGLYCHPYDCNRWYRRDVPIAKLLALRVESAHLERQMRIPVRRRPAKAAAQELAPVVSLQPVPVAPVVNVDELVPASVRRLLDRVVA